MPLYNPARLNLTELKAAIEEVIKQGRGSLSGNLKLGDAIDELEVEFSKVKDKL